MASNFGQLFRITTFGESHGGGVGVVVDGCPPRLELSRRDPARPRPAPPGAEQADHAARRAGPCGDPFGALRGQDPRYPDRDRGQQQGCPPEAYEDMKDVYRPSHADYTYEAKYGIRNGRAAVVPRRARRSAGLPPGRSRASCWPRSPESKSRLGRRRSTTIDGRVDPATVCAWSRSSRNIMRCPDPDVAEADDRAHRRGSRREGDSLGGVVECICRRVPPGLGEPVFDKLEADLARAMLSIPASQGLRDRQRLCRYAR